MKYDVDKKIYIPEVNDTVYIAYKHNCLNYEKVYGYKTVTKVDENYFYCEIEHSFWKEEIVFVIDSYADNHWKQTSCWTYYRHHKSFADHTAYISETIYKSKTLKKDRIDEINQRMKGMSCYKIEQIYKFINETSDTENAEEWEV
jgi:hypothetical protein